MTSNDSQQGPVIRRWSLNWRMQTDAGHIVDAHELLRCQFRRHWRYIIPVGARKSWHHDNSRGSVVSGQMSFPVWESAMQIDRRTTWTDGFHDVRNLCADVMPWNSDAVGPAAASSDPVSVQGHSLPGWGQYAGTARSSCPRTDVCETSARSRVRNNSSDVTWAE